MTLTVALAGGTGFIGRHVVSRLRAAGHRVVVLARGQHALSDTLAESIELRRCDLSVADDDALAEALAGCDALVNLVGIKREAPGLSFEIAHVQLPLRLAQAALRRGITRMIHVSVAGARPHPGSAYLDSKARGEAALQSIEGLALTILRPGVVYGRGDDLLRNLADGVRAAPIFPSPAGRALLAPVAVEDVAESVLRSLETHARARRPVGALGKGEILDVVGPESLPLRELIARVAAAPAVDRRCLVVAMPLWLMRPAAAVLARISQDPLLTPSQLLLLSEGVVGDPEPARRLLGFETRRLDDQAIARVLEDLRPRLPSVRLVPDQVAARALAADLAAVPSWKLLLFALVAVAALLLGPRLIEQVWLRMAVLEGVLLSAALLGLDLRWSSLLRPSLGRVAWGLGAWLVLWAGALGVGAVLTVAAPTLWADTASLYAWAGALPMLEALVLLPLIVAGEEIVWRGALGLAWVPKIGAWPAVGLSAALFTVAHLTTGPPVLALAAALAGAAWAWLAIRTRGLWAPFLCHLLWDICLLWVTPIA